MLKTSNLKNIKIYGVHDGERVQIVKIDWQTKSVSIVKKVFGKSIKLTFKANDPYANTLTIDNFSNIEVVEEE